MLIGLVLAGLLAVILSEPLLVAYRHNPGLNSAIGIVFLIGVFYIFWQVIRLNHDISWIESFRTGGQVTSYAQPRLLAPMASMLRDSSKISLSASTLRSLLDGIQARLDEGREISRYFTSLLILLGLLGTFWGLLGTINSVALAIRDLQVTGSDPATLFAGLKESLQSPLSGMGTAFSASLLGLSGSLVLGYLDLQAGQAQNRFFNELEDWLSSQTKLGGGMLGDGEQPVPVYIQALLEQTAESLDRLQRTIQQITISQKDSENISQNLNKHLANLVDQMQMQNNLFQRALEGQSEMRHAVVRISDMAANGSLGMDSVTKGHLRNVDARATQLYEELRAGREQILQEMRSEIKLLARTIAATQDKER